MRLHNRQVKATFWDDPKLLRMHRDARMLFHGLWHLSDDSGCVEHDAFAFKMFLFRSPADDDFTVERLDELTGLLLDACLVVPYEAGNKRCLFIVNFHKHQSLRSPAPPEVPLPPWVTWRPSQEKQRSGTYEVGYPDQDRTNDHGIRSGPYGHLTDSNGERGDPHGDRTDSNRVRSEPKGNQARARNEPEPEPEPEPELESIDDDDRARGGDGGATSLQMMPLAEVEEYLRGRWKGTLLSARDQGEISGWIVAAGGDIGAIYKGIDAGLAAHQVDWPGSVPRKVTFYTEWVMKQIDHERGKEPTRGGQSSGSGTAGGRQTQSSRTQPRRNQAERDPITTADAPRSRWEST